LGGTLYERPKNRNRGQKAGGNEKISLGNKMSSEVKGLFSTQPLLDGKIESWKKRREISGETNKSNEDERLFEILAIDWGEKQ